MSGIEILGGDFKGGYAPVLSDRLALKDQAGQDVFVKGPDFDSIQIANVESVKKLSGTLGWGAAGAAVLGPVGLLAGLALGDKKTTVTFICELKDGRKFLAKADSKTFEKLRATSLDRGPWLAVPEPKASGGIESIGEDEQLSIAILDGDAKTHSYIMLEKRYAHVPKEPSGFEIVDYVEIDSLQVESGAAITDIDLVGLRAGLGLGQRDELAIYTIILKDGRHFLVLSAPRVYWALHARVK